MLTQMWPLFGLRILHPRVTLRLLDDREVAALAASAVGRVIAPEHAHHMGPWTQRPSPEFEREALKHQWHNRATWTASSWNLTLGVFPADENRPVGYMSAHADDFPLVRSATTGSWLLPERRGGGLGTAAREAILHLLFDGLGACEARSDAIPQNDASMGVSRRLGYQEDGTIRKVSGDGQAHTLTRLLLLRAEWERRRRDDIALVGVDDALPLFGL